MSQEPEDFYEPSSDLSIERPLPNSAEAEQAILGGILIDNALMAEAIELLRPDDFYLPSHRRIFMAMLALFERGSELNPVLVGDELKDDNVGVSLITNLTFGLPYSTNIAHYAKVVRGYSTLRRIAKAGDKMRAEALDAAESAEAILARASQSVFEISLEQQTKSFVRIDILAEHSLQKAYEIQQAGVALTGITSGFADIDAMTSGWQKQDLIIIAGRPSMGKTSLGLMMAQNAAIRSGKSVAFFSLEMSEEQIAMRVLCSEARIDSHRYRSGSVSDEEWEKLGDANTSFSTANLWVDDTPAITVLQLKSKAMRLIHEHGQLDEIIVDYLGLMDNTEDRKNQTREREVALITKGIKRVAKELNVPILLLCQLNRAPETRTDHRPKMADLRESGAIEQDADVVAFVYRADQYRVDAEEKDNTAEIIIAKQRNGPTGPVALRFDSNCARFDNLAY